MLTHHRQWPYLEQVGENHWVDQLNKNDLPWITFGAIEWLDKHVGRGHRVFEWGSGRSTLYLSQRVAELVSIEHDLDWYTVVSQTLKNNSLTNCDSRFIPVDGSNQEYPRAIARFPDNHFDLVIIDGLERDKCITESRPKVKPGGFIILDNSERTEYTLSINTLEGWRRFDFYGPGPRNKYFWQTSVFKKPIS